MRENVKFLIFDPEPVSFQPSLLYYKLNRNFAEDSIAFGFQKFLTSEYHLW